MIIYFEEMQFSDTKCDELPTDEELAELYDKAMTDDSDLLRLAH